MIADDFERTFRVLRSLRPDIFLRRYAVALSDITRLEHKRLSLARTVGLPLGVVAGALVVGVALIALAVGVGARV